MGPIWGWQDPGESHVGPMNLAIWVVISPVSYDVLVMIVAISQLSEQMWALTQINLPAPSKYQGSHAPPPQGFGSRGLGLEAPGIRIPWDWNSPVEYSYFEYKFQHIVPSPWNFSNENLPLMVLVPLNWRKNWAFIYIYIYIYILAKNLNIDGCYFLKSQPISLAWY